MAAALTSASPRPTASCALVPTNQMGDPAPPVSDHCDSAVYSTVAFEHLLGSELGVSEQFQVTSPPFLPGKAAAPPSPTRSPNLPQTFRTEDPRWSSMSLSAFSFFFLNSSSAIFGHRSHNDGSNPGVMIGGHDVVTANKKSNTVLCSSVLFYSCTDKNLNEEGCLSDVVTAPHGKYMGRLSPHQSATGSGCEPSSAQHCEKPLLWLLKC